MKKLIVLAIFLLTSTLAFTYYSQAYEGPRAWMEPEHPTDKDHIALYCRAPGAYDVRFTLCDDDTGMCYILMNETKTDSQTWKIDLYGTLKAGTRAHYEVTVVYQNESTGNESEKVLGPYHFVVESGERSTPSLGLISVISAISISSVLWRMRRID